jgi:hypothetical protein
MALLKMLIGLLSVSADSDQSIGEEPASELAFGAQGV